jgi:hypothetical protein
MADLTVNARVRHDMDGAGTVLRRDGDWLLVLFDGHLIASSVHVDDLTEEGE